MLVATPRILRVKRPGYKMHRKSLYLRKKSDIFSTHALKLNNVQEFYAQKRGLDFEVYPISYKFPYSDACIL